MLLGVVLVVIAFVGVVDVLAGVVLVVVALVDIVHVAGLIAVMLVVVAFVSVMNVFTSVMFVVVTLVGAVLRFYHSCLLRQILYQCWYTKIPYMPRLSQKGKIVKSQ